MNIIIAGDGEVGFYLAKSLTLLDYNITVVDPHSELLGRLEKETDLLTIVGDSTSPKVLEEANVHDCDLFLSVLHDEPINLVTCILAKKLKAKKTVARITNAELLSPKHREMFRDLGVDEMVCPERIAAKEITNLLNHTVATEFFDFSGGLLTMYLIRLEEQSPVNGKSVKELSQIYSTLQVRIVAILRHGVTVIPHSDTVFEAGDMAYIISKANQIDTVKHLAGGNDFDIKNVMIAGGGRIGRYAAMTLEDKTNVLTCLHARRFGIKKTIALVENTGFINISQDIGIDTIINKKLITASYIARFIVKGDAVSSKWLSGTNAELIEFVVGRHAPATRVPIGELRLPEGKATIGGIIRGRETLLPTRDTQLREMDKVVVFALPNAMDKVAKLFD